MTEYNKRVLKNVLEDICEENDQVFLEEIKVSRDNPLFANTKKSDSKIQKALNDSSNVSKKNHRRKVVIRVASVFAVLLIGLSVATLSVKGFRNKIWEFLSNLGNPSYSMFVASDNGSANKLSAYEGQYVPTWIPEGYEVTFVDNKTYHSIIEFENSDGNIILYSEYFKNYESQFYIDKESCDSYEISIINGRETIVAIKDGLVTLFIKEKDAVVQVIFDDSSVDVLGFASYIEKK